MRGNLLMSETDGGNFATKKEHIRATDSRKLEHNLNLLQAFLNYHFHNII